VITKDHKHAMKEVIAVEDGEKMNPILGFQPSAGRRLTLVVSPEFCAIPPGACRRCFPPPLHATMSCLRKEGMRAVWRPSRVHAALHPYRRKSQPVHGLAA
jgi:hypothetical protein